MIFCLLDTETTGLNAEYHEVIQVAAILCNKQLKELDRISFKLAPRHIERASKKALEINGFTPQTWNPDFTSHKIALKYFNSFLGNNNIAEDRFVMAGQNVQFDYNFLKAAYKRENISFPFSKETLDLIQVAKIWSRTTGVRLSHYSLKYLAKFTNQINTNPHDAEADIEVTLDILRWFVNDLKKVSKNDKKRFRKYTSIKI